MQTDIDLTDDLTPLEPERDEANLLAATAPVPTVQPDLSDDLWPSAPPKGVRVRVPSLLLAGLAVAGLGFAGGAFTYKHQHPVAVSTTAGAATPGAGAGGLGAGQGQGQGQRGQGRTGGGAGGGGAPAGATFGTVKTVDGATIYVTDQDGNLVKVTLPDGTTVNATRPGTAADVRPGDTVVIQGAKQPDGSTQAATVSVNPQAGGFARGGASPTAGG